MIVSNKAAHGLVFSCSPGVHSSGVFAFRRAAYCHSEFIEEWTKHYHVASRCFGQLLK